MARTKKTARFTGAPRKNIVIKPPQTFPIVAEPSSTPSRVEPTIICRGDHTICISKDGSVYSFGYNRDGAMGHELNRRDYKGILPKKIPSLTNIMAIACGRDFTMCLDMNGTLFTFGVNDEGQLGIGKDKATFPSTHEPQKVDICPIRQISCGRDFAMCLSEDNEVYSFGEGELGHGDLTHCLSPKKIENLKDVEFVDTRGESTFAKTFNNEIFCWGSNGAGQLGLGNTESQSVPFNCTSTWPDNVVDIKCGFFHTLALTSDSLVYSCGSNEIGQIGRDCDDDEMEQYLSDDGVYYLPDEEYSFTMKKIDELSSITRIECGIQFSICIDSKGSLFVFGSNENGSLGLDDDDTRRKPVQSRYISGIIDISSPANHTIARTSTNMIEGWGENESCQLGVETELESYHFSPIQVLLGSEDIWGSNMIKPKAKSARSILPRIKEKDNSPPKKKQKIK